MISHVATGAGSPGRGRGRTSSGPLAATRHSVPLARRRVARPAVPVPHRIHRAWPTRSQPTRSPRGGASPPYGPVSRRRPASGGSRMEEARLDRDLEEHRGDRAGEARQHVDHREQDGADTDTPTYPCSGDHIAMARSCRYG